MKVKELKNMLCAFDEELDLVIEYPGIEKWDTVHPLTYVGIACKQEDKLTFLDSPVGVIPFDMKPNVLVFS